MFLKDIAHHKKAKPRISHLHRSLSFHSPVSSDFCNHLFSVLAPLKCTSISDVPLALLPCHSNTLSLAVQRQLCRDNSQTFMSSLNLSPELQTHAANCLLVIFTEIPSTDLKSIGPGKLLLPLSVFRLIK